MNNFDPPINLSFGQCLHAGTGLIMPWFTHGALDAIMKMDLSDKKILEYGSGLGDAWLSKQCKELVVIERNYEWMERVGASLAANGCNNVTLISRPCNDCSGDDKYYCAIPEGFEPDVIIVDDAYRYECIINAIEYAKQSKNDSTLLIIDNWQQDYVFICPAAEVALKDYYKIVYPQLDHTDHEGNRWQTAIFNLHKL